MRTYQSNDVAALLALKPRERFERYAVLVRELRDAGIEPPRWQEKAPLVEERGIAPGCEVRAVTEGVLEGDAIVWDAESIDLGGFTETVRKGAVTKSLRQQDVLALWHHRPHEVLGRTSASTLALTETDRGLAFRIDLPDTTLGRDAWETVRRGDVKGASFGFRTLQDRWTNPKEEYEPAFRELLEIVLVDVSPVSVPAYPATTAEARTASLERHLLTCHLPGCTHSGFPRLAATPPPPTGTGEQGTEQRERRLRLIALEGPEHP